MKVQFLGGAEEVGKIGAYIEENGANILIEYGLKLRPKEAPIRHRRHRTGRSRPSHPQPPGPLRHDPVALPREPRRQGAVHREHLRGLAAHLAGHPQDRGHGGPPPAVRAGGHPHRHVQLRPQGLRAVLGLGRLRGQAAPRRAHTRRHDVRAQRQQDLAVHRRPAHHLHPPGAGARSRSSATTCSSRRRTPAATTRTPGSRRSTASSRR